MLQKTIVADSAPSTNLGYRHGVERSSLTFLSPSNQLICSFKKGGFERVLSYRVLGGVITTFRLST